MGDYMKKIMLIFVTLMMLLLVTGCKEEKTKYTVTFENEDGSIYQQVEVEEGKTVTVEDLTKEGYTFDGWYKGEEKVTLPYTVLENITLKAKFNINSYTYKFLSEGKVVSEGSGVYGSTIPYPSNPTKEDTSEHSYKFVSWDKTDTILTGDIVFNAVYEETNKEYTYKFIVDGKVVSEGSGIYGSTIPYPSDPTKTETAEFEYEFISWDKTDTILTGDIVFNAVFESIKKQYTYKFIDDAGNILKQETVDYGVLPIAPTNVNKTGYKFIGWDKDIIPVVEDVVYQAKFKKIETSNPTLNGKIVSILGDSISTFYAPRSEMNSYYSAENTFYYPTYSASIKTVDLTWWYKLIKNNNMKLGINNSWSGSCAYGSSSSAGVSDDRINTIDDNGAPDIVIIYLGTNDCASGYTTDQFGSAIRQIITKVQKLCGADVFVTTLGYTAYTGSKYEESTRLSYNQEIRKIVSEYKCGLIPLDEYIVDTSYSFYLGDNLHYNAKGAELLSKIYEKSIKEYYGIKYTGSIEVEHKEPLPEGVIGKITATADSDFWGKCETNVFLAPSATFVSAQYSYRIEITKQNGKYVVTAIHKSGDNASFNSDYVIVVSDVHASNKAILADIKDVKVGSIVEFNEYGGFPKEILFKEGDSSQPNPPQNPSVDVEGKLSVGAYNEGVWTKYETTVIAYSYEAMDKASTFVNFHIIGITKDGSDYKVTYLKNVDENFNATKCDYYILIYRTLSSKTYFENAKMNQKVVITGDIKTPTSYLEFK